MEEDRRAAAGLIEFIEKSPTAYQAVENIAKTLEREGFIRLEEKDRWHIKAGGGYFFSRNQSSVIAFRIPEDYSPYFMITASHTDSPCFKLKSEYEADAFGKYIRLNAEKYGGMILSTWLDRPLSVAGRVVVREGGGFVSKPFSVDRDLLLIPNVSLHFNRALNEGFRYDPAVDMTPLFSQAGTKGALKKIIAEAAGTTEEKIAGEDLFLYCRAPGAVWGAEGEFFSAPRIDNLMCVYTTLEGFVRASRGGGIQVYAAFDNEETGSGTKQGAGSSLLRDALDRVCEELGLDTRRALSSSFMLSADNAHAKHPNHPELSDAQNAPHLNGGVVIKSNAAQKYATDGVSAALVCEICSRAGVPVQRFANRSDIAGGTTLGGISNTKAPLLTADIGLAQLAMHSAYETAGTADAAYMISAAKAFYETGLASEGDGKYSIVS